MHGTIVKNKLLVRPYILKYIILVDIFVDKCVG